MGWSSYPPEHKRSFKKAVLAYVAIVAVSAGWVLYRADNATKLWFDRVPHATAEIKTVYGAKISQGNIFGDVTNVPVPGEGEGYISIVMTDAGVSDSATTRAIDDLPPPVALAFSPYSRRLDDWLRKASDAHRDSLILLPMEPATYPKDDPGPEALLSRLSEKDNNERLSWVLDKAQGTVGAMNFMGSGFLNDDRNTRPVFDALHTRNPNTVFIEAPTHAGLGVSAETAKAAGMPYLAGDMQIDANATELVIKKQLLDLETLAHKRGYAVGIAQPYPITFTILKDWAETVERRGIKLVPLAAVLKTKVQHDKAAATQQKADEPPPLPPGGQQQPQP